METCLGESVVCLTGGPGTGKSYVIGKVVEKWGRDVCVCAPTGKAVGLLKEKLDVEVGTLHHLLGIRNGQEMLFGGKELDYGMVIVDECSMIDVGMWGALLRNIKSGTRVILVGDDDQLPPVEAGTVFGELCRFLKEKGKGYVHLDECMRSDRAEILEKAAAVRMGEKIEYG
ncbi:MAG: AAA family ATPase, partial [Simkania sp.]|nr:AAA family ATPase [Simkania sp.]